ncbi:MAG: hypothetical protein K0S54_783 [Alphaproteobacteria bacterium]|nr:hypothetical protein [Alphaproteobacteria bacterium]
MLRWLFRRHAPAQPPTRAALVAAEDARQAVEGSRFSRGERPLICWNVDFSQDAALAREAISRTIAALGEQFDYALCTRGIDARRARSILELAGYPVEWRRLREEETLPRLRPGAPELILPAGVAIETAPPWLETWAQGGLPPCQSPQNTVAALPSQATTMQIPVRSFAPGELDGLQTLRGVPNRAVPGPLQRFAWLGGSGQWGVPGWSLPDALAEIVVTRAAGFAGRTVLELGTSRGRLSAMMASLGCRVITVDHQDRGARGNLAGLAVDVVQDDLVRYLQRETRRFDLIVCDLHGNAPSDWRRYRKPLLEALARGGTLILNNAALHRLPDWDSETGVAWFLSRLPRRWTVELHTQTLPGIAIVTSR